MDDIKFWWQKEFQYLLDRKILSRDELAYLFGQIKSIVEQELATLKSLPGLRMRIAELENDIRHYKSLFEHTGCAAEMSKLKAELEERKNYSCDICPEEVKSLQQENAKLKGKLDIVRLYGFLNDLANDIHHLPSYNWRDTLLKYAKAIAKGKE